MLVWGLLHCIVTLVIHRSLYVTIELPPPPRELMETLSSHMGGAAGLLSSAWLRLGSLMKK